VTWLGALPVAALALAWILGPGLPPAYALGLRGATAWGVAPAFGVGSVAIGAVIAGAAGVPWSPLAALAPSLLLTATAAGARTLQRRSRWTPAEPVRDGRRSAVAAAGGTLGAFVLGWLTARDGMGRPDGISQTYDAVFHLNAVEWILQRRDASSLAVGTLTDPSAARAFYPAAWHDLVSLVALGGGGPLPAASNLTAVVVASVVFPLTCLALVRQVVGPSAAAAAVTPLLAVGFMALPWALLTFGVLWPNLVGLALVPAGLAAVVVACGLAREPGMSRGQALVVAAPTAVTLGLAHPNALVSMLVLALVPAAWAVAGWVLARHRAGRWLSSAAVAAVAVAAVLAFAAFLARSRVFDGVRSFDWPAYQRPAQAVGEVLLNATTGKDAAWALSLVVLVGAVAALRSAAAGWLVPAHVVSGVLFLLASSLETPLAALATGVWYNDPYRLAALIPITGVPLAVVGLLDLGSRAAALLPGREALATGVVALALAITSSGLYVRDHAAFLATSYPPPRDAGLVNPAEQAFFTGVAPLVPPGAVVAQNPWSGSSLLWALTGTHVLFPHFTGSWTPDQRYLAEHLREAGSDPRACEAAERASVQFLLVGVVDFWPWDARGRDYPGLARPPRDGFELVAADGQGNELYRLTACRPRPGA
jgi:hypothetical protein